MPFPPVNQLRYVAFHILKANSANSANNDGLEEDELEKAKNHCQRAIFDASEIGIIYYLWEVKVFQQDYRKAEITNIVPNYFDICTKANDANDFIQKMTKETISNHSDSRTKQYQESVAIFDGLANSVKLLTVARPEMNKRIESERRAALVEVKHLRNGRIAVVIAIITLILTALSIWVIAVNEISVYRN